MTEAKLDPRIVRTRQLIMNAFEELAKKKDFSKITIKDITTKATVNRATFYYHFKDKYDLADYMLKTAISRDVIDPLPDYDKINEDIVTRIFLSITHFLSSLHKECARSYEAFGTTIEGIMKKELETMFYRILLKKYNEDHKDSIRIAAAMFSWEVYGAAVDWKNNSQLSPEEYLKIAMPCFNQSMAISDKQVENTTL
ncbi:TetR family transcriptional regulator [Pullulanibacillus camelliae]|uniref:TetR family transcriptional regulator n=1 Tax=Pullulanibacillus camelliae TaxID=1707096 RepID=A0A8J3E0D9_9BACL|nr:TetR family transcriptional regulator [Pullulanibacillus camelliae]GGE50930.1 TetR family transcriptional regulator [Pullulanibacillus camelliae]